MYWYFFINYFNYSAFINWFLKSLLVLFHINETSQFKSCLGPPRIVTAPPFVSSKSTGGLSVFYSPVDVSSVCPYWFSTRVLAIKNAGTMLGDYPKWTAIVFHADFQKSTVDDLHIANAYTRRCTRILGCDFIRCATSVLNPLTCTMWRVISSLL